MYLHFNGMLHCMTPKSIDNVSIQKVSLFRKNKGGKSQPGFMKGNLFLPGLTSIFNKLADSSNG